MGQYLFEEIYLKDNEIDIHIGVHNKESDLPDKLNIVKQSIIDRVVDVSKIDVS
jgi:hypothetical protein